MRASPARERIGAETRVDDRDGGLHRWVGKIGIESDDQPGGQHPLIDDGSAGQARNVKEIPAGETSITNRIFRPSPNDIKFTLKNQVVLHAFASANEYLPDQRLVGFGRLA